MSQPRQREIKRNFQKLPVGRRERHGEGGKNGRKEGGERERAGEQACIIKRGGNQNGFDYIATLEARRHFSRKIPSTLRVLPSQILSQVGGW